MFRFAHPEYLYLLLAAPALVALFAWALYDRRRRLARFGDPATVATLMPDASTGRMKLKFILFTTAVILVILAAARPQFGSKLREQKSEGIEMMLAVDISNSMLAEDFRAQPPRTDEIRDQQAIRRTGTGSRRGDRLRRRRHRTAADHLRLPHGQSLRQTDFALDGLRAGTSIGKALSLAEMSFFERQRRFARHHPHHRRRGSRGQRDAGRRTGRRAGYPDLHDRHRHARRRPDRDRRGVHQGRKRATWWSRNSTRRCCRRSPGSPAGPTSAPPSSRSGWTRSYARSTTWSSRNCRPSVSKEYNEQFQYLIAVAFALLLVEFWLLDRRNPLLARFNIFREQRTDTDNYNPYNR